MSHKSPYMAVMQNPSERLCKTVRGVDDTRDVLHDDVTSFLPFLNGEVLDGNLSGPVCGYLRIHHFYGGHVVFQYGCRLLFRESEFAEDRSEVLGMLCSEDSSEEFGFCGASCCDRLRLASIRHGRAAVHERVSCGGTSCS